MRKQITVFNHDLFGAIRVQYNNGNPWFIAKDITKALGFTNPSDATKYLDEEEKGLIINPSREEKCPIINPSRNGGSKTTPTQNHRRRTGFYF